MRKLTAATLGLVAVLLVVSLAHADSVAPRWCRTDSDGRCVQATFSLDNYLIDRYHARPKVSCPADTYAQGKVDCFAYVVHAGVRRFVEATVTQSQSYDLKATVTHVTSWRYHWHSCSLKGDAAVVRLGSLQSNAPCTALPLTSEYYLAVEMDALGGLPSATEVGWQFANSGPFSVGLDSVASDPCKYSPGTLICTDQAGNAFRYRYPDPARTPLYRCTDVADQVQYDYSNMGCGPADGLIDRIFHGHSFDGGRKVTTQYVYARHWAISSTHHGVGYETVARCGAYVVRWFEVE